MPIPHEDIKLNPAKSVRAGDKCECGDTLVPYNHNAYPLVILVCPTCYDKEIKKLINEAKQ